VDDLLGDEPRGDDVAVLAVRLDPVPLRPLDVTLPSEPDTLRLLRDMVKGWLDRAGIPAGDSRDVLLAVWEAAANAIEHAGAGPGATVHVNVDLAGDRIRVEVGDTGRWKEPSHRPDRGLGLRLIEALMTGVEVAYDERGTTVVMERPLTREPARSHGPHAPDD
jgi:anti-sigma regulatory factor (Ser/Thr protein kinase)